MYVKTFRSGKYGLSRLLSGASIELVVCAKPRMVANSDNSQNNNPSDKNLGTSEDSHYSPVLKVVVVTHINFSRFRSDYWPLEWQELVLEFYVLSTSKVVSGWVPTFDSVYSWRLNSAVPEGDQATSTMIGYPIVILSWHWANQSLPYPNNAECLTKK